MNEEEYKSEINRLRANLRYHKKANEEFKKQNSFLRYDIHLLESKIKRLQKQKKEKDYLLIELLKKLEEKND